LAFSGGLIPCPSAVALTQRHLNKAVQEMTQAEVKVVEKLDMAMIK
jgi:hypothetical protein